jgi:hypothetical protein
MSMKMEQPAGLIEVLLDASADIGDRHDAAMDLGDFDEEAVERALADLACDCGADENLADACGESLAEIWCRRGYLTEEILIRLAPVSLRIAMATLLALCPPLATSANEVLRAVK